MVGGGGRLDFLRFNLVVPVVLVVLGFCEDDIFLSLSLSLCLAQNSRKKNTDRQRQSEEHKKSREALFSLYLCVCAACFSPRARVLIYDVEFSPDRVVVGVGVCDCVFSLLFTTTFFFKFLPCGRGDIFARMMPESCRFQ